MSEPLGPSRRTGVWFGVDVGAVRVGIARSDPRAVLAVPVATLRRDERTRGDLTELVGMIRDYEAVGVVIGLPRTLAGAEGHAVEAARRYGEALGPLIAPIPVVYADERMTTVIAQRSLAASGRTTRTQRAVIDQAAAVAILQSFLDQTRSDQ